MSERNRSVTDRGFQTYDDFHTPRGAHVVVRESSAADEANVWIFIDEAAAHLNMVQATRVRDALNEWLEEPSNEHD